jgi:hypothetical protein
MSDLKSSSESNNGSEDSNVSSEDSQKSISPIHVVNKKKRRLQKSSSTDSPSPPVQNLRSSKVLKTSELATMDDKIKKFFEELVNSSERRTAELIRTEIASVKKDLSGKVTTLENEVANLKLDLARANNEIRKKNLLIEGIPEKRGETWKETELHIQELFKKLGIPENTEIDDCFRLGRPTGGKVRPILLKLTKSRDKKLIFSNCKKLKGTKVFINEDLTKEQRVANGILRKKQKELRESNPTATINIRNGRLTYRDGMTFRTFQVTADNNIKDTTSSSLRLTSSQEMEQT